MKENLIREVVLRFKRNFGGNKKLGKVYAWSLPPRITCPGKTDLCSSICYVDQYTGRYPLVMGSYRRSLEISKLKSFREILTEALSRLNTGIMRIHVSGDFYSAKYAEDWFAALEMNPHIKPFAFTRSWRVPEINAVFKEHGFPPWLMASTDPETGVHPSEFREARMVTEPLYNIRKGFSIRPKLLCDEQINPARSCSDCGRCPTFKSVNSELVQLPSSVIKNGVVFAQH